MKEKKKVNLTLITSLTYFFISFLSIIFLVISHKKLNIEWKLSPYLFPLFVTSIVLIVSVVMFIKSLKEDKDEKERVEKHGDYKRLILFILSSVLYYVLLPYLGFIISSVIFLLGMLLLLGEKRWYVIVLISVLTTVILYFLFRTGLNVLLPKGKLLSFMRL